MSEYPISSPIMRMIFGALEVVSFFVVRPQPATKIAEDKMIRGISFLNISNAGGDGGR